MNQKQCLIKYLKLIKNQNNQDSIINNDYNNNQNTFNLTCIT